MRVRPNRDRSRLIAAAMQKIPCDLTIRNTRFVNVITGEIYPAEVDILDGIVVCVREEGLENKAGALQIYDAGGRYLVPGFIDVHMHVESTMMIPENFGRAAILCGTTSVFVDPHEIGNVLGIEGVRFMIENAKRSPVRQFNLAPSCVPSVPGVEGSGASFGAKEIADLLGIDGVYGIAEVMDFINVVNDSERMKEICEVGIEKNVIIQGHCPGFRGKEAAAYTLAGPTNSHCMNCEEDIKAILRSGMFADMQESSLNPRRMDRLVKGLEGMCYTDHVCLCNDDVHANDLIKTGHVNRLMKSALLEGVHPVDVIRWCTYNPSRDAGIDDIGAVAPGYLADIQLLDELDGRNPYAVFKEGELLVENGVLLKNAHCEEVPEFSNTIHADYISGPEDFKIHVPGVENGTVKAAVLDYGAETARCEVVYEEFPVVDGCLDISGHEGVHYFAVFNRHGSEDHTVALMKNWGLKKGCTATSVAHDCHNLMFLYYKPEDAFTALNALKECGGGVCAVVDEKVTGLLRLPVAGLMSTLECRELVEEIEKAEQAVTEISPERKMMEFAVNALACIPAPVVTDRGIVDGRTLEWIPGILN